jgi:hypothetical protein
VVDAEGDRQPSAGESDKPEQRLPVDLLLPLMHFDGKFFTRNFTGHLLWNLPDMSRPFFSGLN